LLTGFRGGEANGATANLTSSTSEVAQLTETVRQFEGGWMATALGLKLRQRLARATRTHYDTFPFEFIGPGTIADARSLQPPPFSAFVSAHLKPLQRVVDVGCGPGRALVFLESLGICAVGCDLSGVSLSLAARRVKVGRFVQADVLSLPFENATFDAAVCDGVLHHCPDAQEGLVELSRVLKPRGVLYLAVYKRWRYYYYLYTYMGAMVRFCNERRLGRYLIATAFLPPYHLIHLMKSRGQRTWQGSRSFFYDYFVTPRASFHSKSEVVAWSGNAGFELVSYDPCRKSNCHVFVFRKLDGAPSRFG
jgi:ubiquinone/menaquinone biosynthesis C-methylase UbiE